MMASCLFAWKRCEALYGGKGTLWTNQRQSTSRAHLARVGRGTDGSGAKADGNIVLERGTSSWVSWRRKPPSTCVIGAPVCPFARAYLYNGRAHRVRAHVTPIRGHI